MKMKGQLEFFKIEPSAEKKLKKMGRCFSKME